MRARACAESHVRARCVCLSRLLFCSSAAHTAPFPSAGFHSRAFSPHASSCALFTASCSTTRLFASGSHRRAHTLPCSPRSPSLHTRPLHDAPAPGRI
ncbi:hypothetical protein B0H14DRAFT_637067 [Mycena olivaceomarginata]|nr:hypothetical protein B0H14DRAFT_637067 [Mycena olivaceomarginata]